MPEPTSATGTVVAAASAGIGLAALFPGVDGNAVLGAFAGGLMFFVHVREHALQRRVAYLVVSWVMGYQAAPEVMQHAGIQQSGVAAFVAATLTVTVTIGLLAKARSFDILAFFRRGKADD